MVEMNLGIIVCSLATLRPLLLRIIPIFRTTRPSRERKHSINLEVDLLNMNSARSGTVDTVDTLENEKNDINFYLSATMPTSTGIMGSHIDQNNIETMKASQQEQEKVQKEEQEQQQQQQQSSSWWGNHVQRIQNSFSSSSTTLTTFTPFQSRRGKNENVMNAYDIERVPLETGDRRWIIGRPDNSTEWGRAGGSSHRN
jgi:hypothetical protein